MCKKICLAIFQSGRYMCVLLAYLIRHYCNCKLAIGPGERLRQRQCFRVGKHLKRGGHVLGEIIGDEDLQPGTLCYVRVLYVYQCTCHRASYQSYSCLTQDRLERKVPAVFHSASVNKYIRILISWNCVHTRT